MISTFLSANPYFVKLYTTASRIASPPLFGDKASVTTFPSLKISFASRVIGNVAATVPLTIVLFPCASNIRISTECTPGARPNIPVLSNEWIEIFLCSVNLYNF